MITSCTQTRILSKKLLRFRRSAVQTALAAVLVAAFSVTARAQTIFYVNNATGNDANPGTSWGAAFRNVTKAMAVANASPDAEVDIWIAGGIYRPIDGVAVLPTDHNDTAFTFYRGDGVGKALKVYGGFTGTETSIDTRDALHPTYLDGYLGTGNSYHVVVVAGLSASSDSVVIDGVTIRDGIGNGFTGSDKVYNGIVIPPYAGGGIAMSHNGSPKLLLRNCTVSSNSVFITSDRGMGGGAFIRACSPTLSYCNFNRNSINAIFTFSGQGGGGGVFCDSSTLLISYCNFLSDSVVGIATSTSSTQASNAYGGALYNNVSTVTIQHSNFNDNRAIGGNCSASSAHGGYGSGAGIYSASSSVTMSNCDLTGNTAIGGLGTGGVASFGGASFGGGVANNSSKLDVSFCNFTSDSAIAGNGNELGGFGSGGGLYNYYAPDSLTTISNCNFNANISIGGANGLSGATVFWASKGGGVANFANMTLTNCNFTANSSIKGDASGSYGGGFFNDWPRTVVSKCTFTDNISNSANGAAYGGGMASSDTCNVDSCTFTHNSANFGGGFYNNNNRAVVAKSVFQNDSAGYGGAIYISNDPFAGVVASFLAFSNAFTGNVSDSGGGAIRLVMGTAGLDTLYDNVFTHNTAFLSGHNGGAISINGATHFIGNNTFYNDSAANNGGALSLEGVGGSYTVANNIFYGDHGTGLTTDTSLAATAGYYDFENNVYSTTDPLFSNASDPVGADAIWGTADDGLKLQGCSPAVNTGNLLFVPAAETTDITGAPRIVGGFVNMGAYQTTAAVPLSGATQVCEGSTIVLTSTVSGGTWTSSNGNASVTGGTVTGITAGVDTISYTACATTATLVVTVVALPSAGIISGPSAVCTGASIVLTDGTTGGVWSATNTTASVTGGTVTGGTAGTDTIIYTVTNLCGTAADSVEITVSASPSAGSITGGNTVCVGSDLVLTDGVTGGIWSSSNGNASVVGGTVTGVTGGVDTISYTVTAGSCSATATNNVTVNPLPGTGAISGASGICLGSSVTLTATPPGGSWSATNSNASVIGGFVTGMALGTDTILYSLTNSCGTANDSFVVTVSLTPSAGVISGPTDVCPFGSILLTDPVSGGFWTATNANATVTPGSGVVTGVNPGLDTIHYSVTLSCGTADTSFVVTIVANPDSGIISGPTTVCATHTIGLSETVSGGTWYATNGFATIDIFTGVVTGVSTGVDTIYYHVLGACNSANAIYTVTVNPLPEAGSISGPAALCVGTSVTLIDTFSGGTWSATNGHAAILSGVISGLSGGIDTFIYTVTNMCGTDTAGYIDTIRALAVAGSITGPATLCATDSITVADISAVPAGTWSITNANATISVTGIVHGLVAGNDTIKYTTSNVCNSAVATHPITINPLPYAGVISGSHKVCLGDTITLTSTVSGGVWTSALPALSVGSSTGKVVGVSLGSTVISYSYTNFCGTSITTYRDTIITVPDSGIITGPFTVCVGATISLSDPVTGGAWSSVSGGIASVNAGGVVTGTGKGVDTIKYTSTDVCGSTAARYTVTVDDVPVAGTIYGDTAVCPDVTIQLKDTLASLFTGSWTVNDTSVLKIDDSGDIAGVKPGTAIITYRVTNACGTTATSFTITIRSFDSCSHVGVPAALAATELNIFPNPASDELTIKMSAGAYSTVMITNQIGQLVLRQQLNSAETTVDVHTLTPGYYNITLNGVNGTAIRKMIKE